MQLNQELTKNEIKVIRQIVNHQRKSLMEMYGGGKYFNLGEYLHQEEITTLEFNAELASTMESFDKIEADPKQIFALEDNFLIIVRYILHEFIDGDRYPKTKKKLASKFSLTDQLRNHLN